MKFFGMAAAWAALVSASAWAGGSGAPGCGRGWVFFDIGNTLIDTTNENHYRTLPQAHEYLRALHDAGFHLGAISNVPESWGATQEAKLARLKLEIASVWTESQPFEWNAFEAILLPPTNADRKPAPFLFKQAVGIAAGCRIAYEGDDAPEIQAAAANGFDVSYLVGKTAPGEFYLPIDRIFNAP